MGRLFALLGSLFAQLCVATVVSALLIGLYCWSKGFLAPDRVAKMVDVARGIEPEVKPQAAPAAVPIGPQRSFEEVRSARSVVERNLEMREQALVNGVEKIRFEQQRLTDQKKDIDRIKSEFAAELEKLKATNIAKGEEYVRSIWENIEPDQAKQQILLMLSEGEANQVVSLLNAMPIGKKADIIAEFRTDDEMKKIDQLTRLMRKGGAEAAPIDATRDKLDQFDSQASQSQQDVR